MMKLKERYDIRKAQLLRNPAICQENRKLFCEFLVYEERKLKRINHLSRLDAATYKTLSKYLTMLRNVNTWFKSKPWQDLTKKDMQQIYDDLEEDRILNSRGKPIQAKSDYYSKVFKSKPFRLAGKAELAREVIEYSVPRENQVRFVTEENFRKIVSVLSKPHHLLLFWLAWDVGENIGTLLQLTKQDFTRQHNPHTQGVEYLIHLPREKLKRSRQMRSEPTLYQETVQYADMVLEKLSDHEPLFAFGHRQALKLFQRTAEKTGATCLPHDDKPTWKDLRSGMACHLLKSGWTSDEVNARLGHTPGSTALGAYINYLAIDRQRPKQKHYTSNLEFLQRELTETKQRERLQSERIQHLQDNLQALQQAVRELLEHQGIVVST